MKSVKSQSIFIRFGWLYFVIGWVFIFILFIPRSYSYETPNFNDDYTQADVVTDDYQDQYEVVTLPTDLTNHISLVLASLTSGEDNDKRESNEGGGSEYFQEGDFFTVRPTSCSVQGDGPIYGWTWLRKDGDFAYWTFEFSGQNISVKAAALNFSLLVTNQASGGSGFTSNPKVKITDLNGRQLGNSILHLVNTFRPKYTENTVGVGYPASGAIETSLIKQLVSQRKSFIITIEWPAPDHNHLAVKCDSVLLAYVVSSNQVIEQGKNTSGGRGTRSGDGNK